MTVDLRAGATMAVLALLASACSGLGGDAQVAPTATDEPDPETASPDATGTESGTTAAGDHGTCIPLEEFDNGGVANAEIQQADFPWNRADPAVFDGFDPSQIISGGPPPDGIMPIDEPCFDTVASADEWLEPNSPVLTVEVNGDHRAYPLAIMTQHEIVNDVVGGEPLVVTYCPLCNSGLAFERTVDGDVLDFGTSGRLFQTNLVMYDRQTKSLWVQFSGRAVIGEDYVGTELVRVPTGLLGWEAFKESAPDGMVLSRESVSGRSYGRNPYPGYEEAGNRFLFQGPTDDRLPPQTRIVGLGTDVDPVAITLDELRAERVVDVAIDDAEVTVWWAPGQASALDQPAVDAGRDVGSTSAFVRTLEDGTALTFRPDDGDDTLFVDEQTGSTWNLLGEAVEGELTGTQLTAVARDDTWWFVWFAFQPETEIVGTDAVEGAETAEEDGDA